MTKPFAACLLAFNDNGEVLQVTRRDNLDDWGLPGGKWEPEDGPLETDPVRTLAATAARETHQEAKVRVWNLVPIFEAVDPTVDKLVLTYLALEYDDSEIGTGSEEGLVRWGPYEATCKGTFGFYNEGLLAKVQSLKGVVSRFKG